jgi:hypothetical protein
MKVNIKNMRKNFNQNKINVLIRFISFLGKHFPLKTDIEIVFTEKSEGEMTTGSNKNSKLKVIGKNRMFIDVLRTLSHEWVHEHQFQHNRKNTKQDIGGPDEDEANAESGKLLKLFSKENSDDEETLYE